MNLIFPCVVRERREILEPTFEERESEALNMACKLTHEDSKKPMNIKADTHLF